MEELGVTRIATVHVENVRAGGSTAIRSLYRNIAADSVDIGVVSMTTSPIAGMLISLHKDDLDGQLGFSMPVPFALRGARADGGSRYVSPDRHRSRMITTSDTPISPRWGSARAAPGPERTGVSPSDVVARVARRVRAKRPDITRLSGCARGSTTSSCLAPVSRRGALGCGCTSAVGGSRSRLPAASGVRIMCDVTENFRPPLYIRIVSCTLV